MVTLQDLRYVITLDELKHFARAAEACFVSQPTLSTQIKKLEAELGVALFERSNRRVLPTPAGVKLIAQARVVLQEVDKLRDMAQQAHDPMSGPIQLGVIPTLGPYLLPHLVPHLREEYPSLRLYLREDLTVSLVERLRTGVLDAILVALPIHADGLEIYELFREPFVMALPEGDPLAEQVEVSEADLDGASLLLLEDGHCLRDQALAVCGLPARGGEEFRASSLETLRQMVAAGVGCTLLPLLATHTAPPGELMIELRPFASPAPYRVIGLAVRRGFPRLEMATTLAAFIRRYAPAGVTVTPAPAAEAPAARAKRKRAR